MHQNVYKKNRYVIMRQEHAIVLTHKLDSQRILVTLTCIHR